MKRNKEKMIELMEKMNAENSKNKGQKDDALSFFSGAIPIGNKVFCCIPEKLLKIDHENYQRPLESSINKISDNWNDDKCDAITVNYRNDGYFYVINGQHRTEAARKNGIKNLLCDVFVGLSLAEEAELFVTQYDGNTKIRPTDSYRANILRGEIVDTTIKNICDEYGLTITRAKVPCSMKSITVVRRIVNQGIKGKDEAEQKVICESNAEKVRWIFDIISKSGWNAYADAYNADVMQSLSYVWNGTQNKRKTAMNRLIEVLSNSSPMGVKSLGNIKYPDMGHGGGVYRVFMDVVEGRCSAIEMEKIDIPA